MHKIEWNKVTWYSKLLAVILFVGVFFLGLYLGAAYNEAKHYQDEDFSITASTSTNEIRFNAYLTAYTYWDNTPPGSSDISHPIVHQKAGGTGTFSDPITLAVGHSYATHEDVLDYPAGTKFYLPYLKKYFIVEDTCGDGETPENGPCHTGYEGHPWLDMWIDGASGSRSVINTCAEDITKIHTVIQNPGPNYAVIGGAVYQSGCAQQFDDIPVAAS